MAQKRKAGISKGQAHYKKTKRGSIILPNGDRITPKEQKAFRSAVNSANRKRKRLIENLPKEARERYAGFGGDSDFVARHKSTSFARFRNKSEFNRYFRGVKKIASRDYIDSVVANYRRNLNKAIDNVFNSSGKPLKDYIKKLSNSELRELTLSGEFDDIGYVYYEPISVKNKLAKMTKQVEAIKARNA